MIYPRTRRSPWGDTHTEGRWTSRPREHPEHPLRRSPAPTSPHASRPTPVRAVPAAKGGCGDGVADAPEPAGTRTLPGHPAWPGLGSAGTAPLPFAAAGSLARPRGGVPYRHRATEPPPQLATAGTGSGSPPCAALPPTDPQLAPPPPPRPPSRRRRRRTHPAPEEPLPRPAGLCPRPPPRREPPPRRRRRRVAVPALRPRRLPPPPPPARGRGLPPAGAQEVAAAGQPRGDGGDGPSA